MAQTWNFYIYIYIYFIILSLFFTILLFLFLFLILKLESAQELGIAFSSLLLDSGLKTGTVKKHFWKEGLVLTVGK